MQVRIEEVSPVEKKMFVEIPWETVSAKLNDQYKELSKGVALKGFRKGKVPRPVLEQVYGPRVNAEVAYELVRESFFKANQEHHLAAVAEPRKLNIPETAVDESLAQLVREHTELRPIEGREVTAAGDIVGLSITGTIGEHQINPPPFAVDFDDDEREPLPGMRAALLGVPLDTKDKKLEIT